MSLKHLDLLTRLQQTVLRLTEDFQRIPESRKSILNQLTSFVRNKNGGQVNLNFICTHNSRRSHISQIWAQTAAHYYNISKVQAFSGGTEATAFNPRAVTAMKNVGFHISVEKESSNPEYAVRYSEGASPIFVFSKTFDSPVNPKNGFAAIMTCSHADENCPLIPGAELRIPLTYNDPKDFDGTALEADKYRERVLEIGREILYAFSQVNDPR